jgi:hypothetical protein
MMVLSILQMREVRLGEMINDLSKVTQQGNTCGRLTPKSMSLRIAHL